MLACPVCQRSDLVIAVPRDVLASEMRLRRRFYRDRIDGFVDRASQKDVLDVAHDAAAEVAMCPDCEVLVRREAKAPRFETDHYEPFAMERMLRAHIKAYRHKARSYRSLLPPGSRVVEIGSYVGGFLHVAREWGWDAIGVDVGGDTSHFARAHGYQTREEPIEKCNFDPRSFDGVFIWNCFEQIEDPHTLLAEVARILRPGGVVVIRTPNATLYRERRDPVILGHSNLLGFPHLFGYTATSLERLLAMHGFTASATRTDRHIDPGIRPMTATARREAARLRNIVRTSWIEATFLHAQRAEASMPEKTTIERARRDRAQGKAPTTQAGEFVREEMEHIRRGKHGARSTKQAIAIGLSKARRAGVKLSPPSGSSSRTRASARSAERNRGRKPSATRSRAVRSALKREGRSAASRTALSRQAHKTARRRSAASRSRSAKKAAATRKRESH
jgi:SAM-dependent methyltransferase